MKRETDNRSFGVGDVKIVNLLGCSSNAKGRESMQRSFAFGGRSGPNIGSIHKQYALQYETEYVNTFFNLLVSYQ